MQDISLSRLFIGATVFPFTSSLSSFAKTVAIAYNDRIGLAMHLIDETALGIGVFNLHILIIVGMCTGHRIMLEFDIFPEILLFITAFTMAVERPIWPGGGKWIIQEYGG